MLIDIIFKSVCKKCVFKPKKTSVIKNFKNALILLNHVHNNELNSAYLNSMLF
jgi:hypothetical protein